jgi:hypothetical protein
MMDFFTWPFRKLWDLVSWIFTAILWLLGQTLWGVWWLIKQALDLAWYLFQQALSLLVNLYLKVTLEYPGVALAVFPLAWLVHKKWVKYNVTHNIDPPEFWKRPTFVTVIATPLIIALLAKMLPSSSNSIPNSSPLEFFAALNNPLVGAAFALFVFFAGYSLLVRLGILKATNEPSLLRLIIHYSFAVTFITVAAGFGLAAFQTYLSQ